MKPLKWQSAAAAVICAAVLVPTHAYADELVPERGLIVDEWAAFVPAGVIDDQIQRAVAIDHPVERGGDGAIIGDVGPDVIDVLDGAPGKIAIDHGDERAAGDEGGDDCSADSLHAAGDDGALAGERGGGAVIHQLAFAI